MKERYCVYKDSNKEAYKEFANADQVITYLANHQLLKGAFLDNGYNSEITYDLENKKVTVKPVEKPNGITTNYSPDIVIKSIAKPISDTIYLLNLIWFLEKLETTSASTLRKCIQDKHRDEDGRLININLEVVSKTLLEIQIQLKPSLFTSDKRTKTQKIVYDSLMKVGIKNINTDTASEAVSQLINQIKNKMKVAK